MSRRTWHNSSTQSIMRLKHHYHYMFLTFRTPKYMYNIIITQSHVHFWMVVTLFSSKHFEVVLCSTKCVKAATKVSYFVFSWFSFSLLQIYFMLLLSSWLCCCHKQHNTVLDAIFQNHVIIPPHLLYWKSRNHAHTSTVLRNGSVTKQQNGL